MENTTSNKPVKQTDTYSYKGWLVSDNFFKRCFAVYGYYLVAGLILGVIFFLVFGLIALIMGGSMIGMMTALNSAGR